MKNNMKALLLFLFMTLNGFSQQLYRYTFSGGYATSDNGISLVGETFNRTNTVNNVTINESILYQIAGATLTNDDLDIDTNISIYPNPVSEILYIKSNDFSNLEYSLYDVLGNRIFSKYQGSSLNVQTLQAGMYVLSIYDKAQQRRITLKFIKK